MARVPAYSYGASAQQSQAFYGGSAGPEEVSVMAGGRAVVPVPSDPIPDGPVLCAGTTRDGRPCGARPVHGEELCVGHKRSAEKVVA